MSKFYSNEIVFRGHPDKTCDQIGGALLNAYVKQDKNTRAGIEVTGGKGKIFITGEVTTKAKISVKKIVKRVLKDIGYSTKYKIINNLGTQSPDIAQGVDFGGLGENAGDQGMMFGYACNDTKELLPTAMVILQKLAQSYDEIRKQDKRFLPDGKAQITGEYDDNFKLLKIKTFTISYNNTELEREDTDKILKDLATSISDFYNIKIEQFLINPTGKFLIGGFEGDTGLCLNEDTLISTTNGLVKIKELNIGDEVYTEKDRAKIISFYDNGIKDTLIIKDETGQEIEATHNHPFRVWDGNDIIWKEAGLLQIGDTVIKKKQTRLVTDRDGKHESIKYLSGHMQENREIKLNADFAYLLGHLIGDGNTTATDRITFYYGCEQDKHHIYNQLLKVFPSGDIKHYDYQDDRFYILSQSLVRKIQELGVLRETSRQKEVPHFILKGSNKIKKAFISGLFDTDGHIDNESGRDGEYVIITLSTTSNFIAQQVATLLYTMGIYSYIGTRTLESHFKSNGEFVGCNGDAYTISIRGLRSIKYFIENIGFRNKRRGDKVINKNFPDKWRWNDYGTYNIYKPLKELLQLNYYKLDRYFNNFTNKQFDDRNYGIAKLQEVVDIYAEYQDTPQYKKVKNIIDNFDFVKIEDIQKSNSHTYDITLDDDTHSFIANGFIVHNTGRKIVVDAYQSFANVGGGSMNGKDMTKVDVSGAYKARQIACRYLKEYNLKWVEIQLSYAIGKAEPLAIYIDSDKGNIEPTRELYIECKPRNIIKDLKLLELDYEKQAQFGHFTSEKLGE